MAVQYSHSPSPYSYEPMPLVPAEPQPDSQPRRVSGVISRIEGASNSRLGHPQDYSMLCILGKRGSATYTHRGQRFEVRPSTILWVVSGPANVLDAGLEFVSSPDYSAWGGFFGPQIVQRARYNASAELALHDGQGGAIIRRLAKLSARRLETQFEHLDATDLNTEQYAVGLEYLLLSAWAEHQKATRICELADVHPAVEKAAYILRTQPDTGSMQELAHACGASASWLSRLFRQQVGISLVGYRNQARIERFFELYGGGQRRNLTQAAYAAGFGSYAQFHRVFKEALGYSPGELKRNMQDGTAPALHR